MARQEFRFVIDGPELTSEQRDRIGSAVQRAGLESLTHAKVDLESPIVIGTTGIKFRPEWIGLWVLDRDIAGEIGPQIDKVLGQRFGG
jgi:hypothetical protein